MTSPRNGEQVVVLLRAGASPSLDRDVHFATVALCDVVLRRHALPFSAITSTLSATPSRDDESSRCTVRFTKQNARIEHVGREQDREAEVVDPVRSGSRRTRARSGCPARGAAATAHGTAGDRARWKLPFVDDDDRRRRSGSSPRRRPRRHGTDRLRRTQEQTCTTCVRRRAARSSGSVVDEGQMVAEEDPIAVLDDERYRRRGRHRRARCRARALHRSRLPVTRRARWSRCIDES